jgi:hypothetical protein
VLGIAARLPDAIEQALNATADRFADGAPYRRVGAYTTSYDRGAGLVDAYAAAVRLGAGRGVDKPAGGADRLLRSVDAMKGGRSS